MPQLLSLPSLNTISSLILNKPQNIFIDYREQVQQQQQEEQGQEQRPLATIDMTAKATTITITTSSPLTSAISTEDSQNIQFNNDAYVSHKTSYFHKSN